MNFTQEQRYEIIEKIIKEGKRMEEILKKDNQRRKKNGRNIENEFGDIDEGRKGKIAT